MSQSAVKEPSALLTTCVSLLIHGGLIAGIFFLAQHKPLPEVVSIQTSLASAGDLADAKAQIAKAYAKNQSAQSVVDVPDSRSQTTDYQSDLSAKEQAYQEQMKAYAKALDDEILSEFSAQKEAYDAEDKARQQAVNELSSKERSNDDIAKENRKALEQAKTQRQESATSSNESAASDDSPRTPSIQGNSSTHANAGNQGTSNSNSSGSNKNAIIAAIQERIERNWSPSSGLAGKRLSVTIRIDASGNLKSIQAGSGDKELQDSLESAIRAAAPFPEASGVMTSFAINFYAD